MEQNKKQNNIDLTVLKKEYSENEIAAKVFEVIKENKGKSNVTIINELNEKLNIPRQKLVAFFKQLQKANCGRFVAGRWDNPSRFKWDVDIKSVIRIAEEKTNEVNSDLVEELKKSNDGNLNSNILTHIFFLRSDFTLELKLPTDLSTTGASRLADFIKTLPFS